MCVVFNSRDTMRWQIWRGQLYSCDHWLQGDLAAPVSALVKSKEIFTERQKMGKSPGEQALLKERTEMEPWGVCQLLYKGNPTFPRCLKLHTLSLQSSPKQQEPLGKPQEIAWWVSDVQKVLSILLSLPQPSGSQESKARCLKTQHHTYLTLIHQT